MIQLEGDEHNEFTAENAEGAEEKKEESGWLVVVLCGLCALGGGSCESSGRWGSPTAPAAPPR
jgi:hypothetical protein